VCWFAPKACAPERLPPLASFAYTARALGRKPIGSASTCFIQPLKKDFFKLKFKPAYA